MSQNSRGFTLVELIVTVFVLALISAATVPQFVKSRLKAREAEVKSNIHSIQIAIERYAVDTGGIYPTFLIGADREFNCIRAQFDSRSPDTAKIKNGATPFAKRNDSSAANQQFCFITRDPLIEFGYLTEYPTNPFAKKDNGMWSGCLSGPAKAGQFPFGGEHGDRMFDLGFGWGDTPQTDFTVNKTDMLDEQRDDGSTSFADPDMDAPGNFYYHPVFADMQPVYVHYLARYNNINHPEASSGKVSPSFGITGDEAIGYYLYGYGQDDPGNSIVPKGLDVFNRMPANDSPQGNGKFKNIKDYVSKLNAGSIYELDSSINNLQKRVETTGYPAAEYDPWTEAYPDGINPMNPAAKYSKSGPDGVPDWVIIEVRAGCDVRSDTINDTYTYGGKESYYAPAPGKPAASPTYIPNSCFPPSSGGTDYPNQKPYDLTFFESYGVNPFIPTEDENTSTFGMDVDTASYTICRRFLTDGNIPDKDSIRTEEFINYFDHKYAEPEAGGVFSITCEGAESEFGRPNYHLLKIGIKAMDVRLHERPPANMVFVVDTSGSMQREDRLEQVKRSLRTLAGSLLEGDKIGLVVYGSRGMVISGLTSNHDAILSAIGKLRPEGSTNAEEGLKLGYRMARENFDERKINRIILCSDGVANVGNTGADEILKQVKDDAKKGITLTTIGFGMGNYNDVLMEKLANHGDGMYYYIDTNEESGRIFGNGAAQLLVVMASDAKIQVEFNPETVDRFRLLGYENRRLEKEDFRDDTIDAGEVGSGQAVTALYEIRIKDSAQGNIEDSATNPRPANIATVRIRYLNLMNHEVEEYHKSVTVRDLAKRFDSASRDFRFTAAVAEFAEVLKKSYWAKDSTFDSVLRVVQDIAEDEKEREFVNLVRKAVVLDDR